MAGLSGVKADRAILNKKVTNLEGELTKLQEEARTAIEREMVASQGGEEESVWWARVATKQSVVLLVLTLVVAAGDTALRVLTGMVSLLGGNVWLQAIVALDS